MEEVKNQDGNILTVLKEQTQVTNQGKGLKGDYGSICLLVFLYILEGIPLGILSAIPMIMASNNVAYGKQAIFTFATYPYAMKLLWAPIVDSVYWEKFGRRKSWIVPVQYLIGVTMIITSLYSGQLLGTKQTPPNIYLLTGNVLFLVFLVATQDVAIDAWALTLLSKRNIHHASSCSGVGCLFGVFMSNTLLLALESAKFCNKWIRSVPKETGLVTVGDFLFGAGILFIVITTFLCIFKNEKHCKTEGDTPVKGILNTYKMLAKILRLRSIRYMALVMFTQYIGHAVIENVTDLKLIQFGVKRENISILKVPISVIHLFLPFYMAAKTKNNPLFAYWCALLFRLLAGCLMVAVVFWTQTLGTKREYPFYYYFVVFLVYLLYDVIRGFQGVSLYIFNTKIADPKIGATYITLISTLHNIGSRWTNTVSVWVVDILTINIEYFVPSSSEQRNTSISNQSNGNVDFNSKFVSNKGVTIDGYYVEFLICFILGLLWLKIFKRIIMKMQNFPVSEWRYYNEEITKF